MCIHIFPAHALPTRGSVSGHGKLAMLECRLQGKAGACDKSKAGLGGCDCRGRSKERKICLGSYKNTKRRMEPSTKH